VRRRRIDESVVELAHDSLELALLDLQDSFGCPQIPPLGDERVDARALQEQPLPEATSEACAAEASGAAWCTRG
jgi:hypothetical protein